MKFIPYSIHFYKNNIATQVNNDVFLIQLFHSHAHTCTNWNNYKRLFHLPPPTATSEYPQRLKSKKILYVKQLKYNPYGNEFS